MLSGFASMVISTVSFMVRDKLIAAISCLSWSGSNNDGVPPPIKMLLISRLDRNGL